MTEQQARKLGALIRAAREAKGLTYREVEAMTGLSLSLLAYLEAGRSLEPMPDRIARLAEALDIDPAAIDRVSGKYLAQSLPTVRTYFRSKGQASETEIVELERVIAEVQAKYRRSSDAGRSASAKANGGQS